MPWGLPEDREATELWVPSLLSHPPVGRQGSLLPGQFPSPTVRTNLGSDMGFDFTSWRTFYLGTDCGLWS
jgi:hypothetical protein